MSKLVKRNIIITIFALCRKAMNTEDKQTDERKYITY